MIALRPYQTELVTKIRAKFATHRRVLAVAPTGAGKTVTFAYITQSAAAKGNRVFVVAHRAEIIEQISGALAGMGVRHGRIQPGHSMTADPVQVGMIQTIARRLDRIAPPDLLVVDEAHHGVAGTWQTVCEAWSSARILGVTATPQRLDGKGLGGAFDAMVIGPNMHDLINAGFLARYRYLAPPERIDLSGVKTRMGDYSIDELAAAVDKSIITGDAIQHYQQHLTGRPAVAFCVTVQHAEHVAEQFRAAGIRAASVDGAMERTRRRAVIAGIGDGTYQVLTSCELISEGVDIPVVAGAILLRPTQSLGMYLQQVGRALRLKPDGGDAVILDHVGNVHRHGMPDAPREWSLDAKKRKPSAAGTTTCEECYRVFPSSLGWKAEQTCQNGAPPGCVLHTPEKPAERAAMPEQVEGTLTEISNVTEWSNGLDLALGPLGPVLKLAKTREQVEAIRKARKYHPRWTHHIMAQRGLGAPVPFAPTSPPPPPSPAPRPAARREIEEVLFS